jgi:hypothetical protein
LTVPNNRRDIVTVGGMELIRSTEKAGLYVGDDGSEVWIPFSQLSHGSIDTDGQSGEIYIPRWLAEDKELEYEES